MSNEIKAVLLVGGMGTRLRTVLPNTPKPLAAVGDKSFLDLLVRQLRYQGIRRLVMCTGYLSDQIEKAFGDGHDSNVAIKYSREPQPLGTAGALKLAQRYLQDVAEFLVMNGDSFLEIDFSKLMKFHRQHGGIATMAVRQVENAGRYGTVQVNASGHVRGFAEKTGSGAPGLINAGVYVFSSAIFQYLPEGPASLETDVFPRLLDHKMYAVQQHGLFIDIGTPEDYARAQQICDRLQKAALSDQVSSSCDDEKELAMPKEPHPGRVNESQP
jgi:D-glycero-alpha-D-manno-heptose 1-phosphate guanylyltransferase